MEQIPTDAQKRKNSRPRQTGCLKLLLIPILLALACYGGMWLFARYGGEWAMSDQIPVPPESQLLLIAYQHNWYTARTTLYSHPWSPEELRDWFRQAGLSSLVAMSYPLREDEDARNDTYTTNWTSMTPKWSLLRSSVFLTADWDADWRSNGAHLCSGLRVYKTEDAFQRDYPDLTLLNGLTAFAIITCWPNVDKAPPNQPVPLN